MGLAGILVARAATMSLAKLSAILTTACTKMTQLERGFTRKSGFRSRTGCEPYLRRRRKESVLCRQKKGSLRQHVTLFSSIAPKLALK